MRRVITVSLSGNAFALDEDAYERLRAFWASTELRLGTTPERARIIADMEQSVADHIVAIRPQTNDAVVSDMVMLQVLTGLEGANLSDSPAGASIGSQTEPSRSELGFGATQQSEYTRLPVFILCLFLGWFGLHRMFVGKIGTGLLQLVTLGGLGIWTLYDLILIVFASFEDSDGRKIVRWA